jgi:hypothetical protein
MYKGIAWTWVNRIHGMKSTALHRRINSHLLSMASLLVSVHVSFCLMKNDRKCDNCQAHVRPKTPSCTRVHRTIFALVASLWSRNSASRSYRFIWLAGLWTTAERTHPLEDLLPPDVL